MSVILEFTVDSTEFRLGEVLSGPEGMHIELERIVPTGTQVMPFVWVTGDDHESFEAHVRASGQVRELLALDSVDDSRLYRIEWEDPPSDLLAGLAASEATVLEAEGRDSWRFRLRFPSHEYLASFHDYCTDYGIHIDIERTYTFRDEHERRRRFGLSEPQREALVLALERGYFETPSEADLDDLAAELDISRQALSARLRRGNQQILETVLLGEDDTTT
jgi:predicted DNA binding protein